MKTNKLILFFLLSGFLFLSTCKKLEKEMRVTTGVVTNILTTIADVSGEVLDLGEGANQHGHCYSKTANPTVDGTKTTLGTPALGGFTSSLTGLDPVTKYYVKAYLSRGTSVVYGEEVNFTTASAEIPTLTTTEITGITKTGAVGGGNITSQGGTAVTARGVCWSTATITAITSNKTTDGSGTGSFTSEITGLSAGTLYYVRAYATNSGGTKLGNEVTFTSTPDTPVQPAVTTTEVTSVTINSAVSGGNVTSEGSSSVTARGVCWSTSENPTTSNYHTTDGTGPGSFTSNIPGGNPALMPGTLYYVRAYATNNAGTSYGTPERTFTTLCIAPTATTNAASAVGSTTATLNGTVNANGFSTTVTFEWGLTTSYGTTATASQSPVTGSTNVEVSAGLTGLTLNTTYHYRVKAVNCEGTSIYGGDQQFMPLCDAPTATTNTASAIGTTTATLNGTVNANGFSTTVTFEWGLTTGYGSTATATQSPVTGTSSTIVSAGIIGLTSNTLYHYRVIAVSCGGTVYGGDITVTTLATLTTTSITNIAATTASSGGTIAAGGGASITARGVCWSTTSNPTIANSITTDGTGTGSFTSSLTGLTSNTLYYVRAYATNAGGTNYGSIDVIFTSLASLTTTAILNITSTSASSGGSISVGGGGTITARGVCWRTSSSPTIADSHTSDGSGTGSFTSSLTSLTPGTTYYIRAYATNSAGTAYGDNELSFKTSAIIPTLSTVAVTSITAITAISGGNITNDGGASITDRGVCWRTSSNPTIADAHTSNGSGTGNFSSNITGLTSATTYYVKAFATNIAGTAYGNEVNFTTSLTVTHTFGTVAASTKTVTYGIVETNLSGTSKRWITQNLGADHQASSATDATEASAGWYWQFNHKQGFKHNGTTRTPNTTWIDPINEASDWVAANDPCTILLGTGWRIPTQNEWTNVDNNGGWTNYNNTYASILKIHAAGYIYIDGLLYYRGSNGLYWSNTQNVNTIGWGLGFNNSMSSMSSIIKSYGNSIRCVKD